MILCAFFVLLSAGVCRGWALLSAQMQDASHPELRMFSGSGISQTPDPYGTLLLIIVQA